MKLTMLGTGNAVVTECYNTCFVLSDKNQHFLIDGGGGNTLLHQLKKANIPWMDIHEIFVTHKHIDHILGIIWMIRMITQHMSKGTYHGDTTIYAHEEVIQLLKDMAHSLLQAKDNRFIDNRLHFVVVKDGDVHEILHRPTTFFDIHSTKAKQFGFMMQYEDQKKLTCCGDEPYNISAYSYAKDSTWLLHEAFCLFSQANLFDPYKKHHSTVKDACEIAQNLQVKNIVLYHTEDKNMNKRKELYLEEGTPYFNGNIYVPDDLEVIEL